MRVLEFALFVCFVYFVVQPFIFSAWNSNGRVVVVVSSGWPNLYSGSAKYLRATSRAIRSYIGDR